MSKTYPQFPDTTFPDAIQPLVEYLDIESADLALYNSYIGFIANEDYNAAQRTLQQITNFDKKIITAQKLNQLTDTIMALQTLYQSDAFQSTVTEFQNNWLQIINQFSYKGVWTDTETYKKNSMVKYQSPFVGDDQTPYLYIASKDIEGTEDPYNDARSENPQWIQLTMRGVRGDSGEGLVFDFDWDSTKDYPTNVVVVHNDTWWGCKVANIGQEPSTTSAYWELLLGISTIQIPVQSAQPTTQVIGDLWFKVV